MSQHVYMIRKEAQENSYKIGRSDSIMKRIQQYGNPEIIIMLRVNDCRACEAELLTKFKEQFASAYEDDGSSESFKGDVLSMQTLFLQIASKHLEIKAKRIDIIEQTNIDDPIIDELEDPISSQRFSYEFTVYEALKHWSSEALSKYVTNIKQYVIPKNVQDIDVKKLEAGKYSYQEVRNLFKEHFPSIGISLKSTKIVLEQALMEAIHMHSTYTVPDRSPIPKVSKCSVVVPDHVDMNEKDMVVLVVKLAHVHKCKLELYKNILDNAYNQSDRRQIRKYLNISYDMSLEAYAADRICVKKPEPKMTNADMAAYINEVLGFSEKPVVGSKDPALDVKLNLSKLRKAELQQLIDLIQ